MLVRLGEKGVKTIEDFADCASDDLIGWTEGSGPNEAQHPGILADFGLTREQTDAMITSARVLAGWISEPPPAPTEPTA